MVDEKKGNKTGIGVLGKASGPPRSVLFTIALIFTLLWVAFVFIAKPGESASDLPEILLYTLYFIPPATVWLFSYISRKIVNLFLQIEHLQATMDGIRNSVLALQRDTGGVLRPSLEKKLEEIIDSTRETEAKLATFVSSRGDREGSQNKAVFRRVGVSEDEKQISMALGSSGNEGGTPVSVADFIRALNFPESESDQEGFKALRAALKDVATEKLVRAAEDILVMLSQDGVYVDDLRLDPPRPDLWRRFAAGVRGHKISGMAGVYSRSPLGVVVGRLKTDSVFRDTVHHFIRIFDQTFTHFEKNADDEEIIAFADTRTARAFCLVGRASGTFD